MSKRSTSPWRSLSKRNIRRVQFISAPKLFREEAMLETVQTSVPQGQEERVIAPRYTIKTLNTSEKRSGNRWPIPRSTGPLPVPISLRPRTDATMPVVVPVTPPELQAQGAPSKKNTLPDFDDDPDFDKVVTIPMLVLMETAKQEKQPKPNMQSEISGTAGAAGLMGLGNVLGSILKFVATFIIQYSFGRAVYGLYTLSTSLVNLIASVFNLGLDDAMVRYVAIYRSKKKHGSLQGLVIFCTIMAGAAGLAGALLLLFFTPDLLTFNSLKHGQDGKDASLVQAIPLIQMMAPLIPLFCMQVVWVGGLRGFKAFKWRILTGSIVQPIIQILLLLGVVLFFRRYNLPGIAIALLISTTVSVVFNLYFLFRQVSRITMPKNENYEVREWLSFASLNFLTTIIDTVLDSIDTILLAVFGVPKAQIGEYGAAIRFSIFISLPLVSLNNIFAPTIAELHAKGERQKLESMFKVVTKWTITFSLPIFLIVTLFSPYVLALSGADFMLAWPLLIAFSIGGLINAGTGAVGYMLLMTGYQRLSFLNSLVAVGVNVGLGILLTPKYGAMGTAIGTGLAVGTLNLMRLLQVGILLKMQPYRRDVWKPLTAAAISAALIGGMLYLLSLTHLKLYVVLGHAIISFQLLLIPLLLAIYIWLVIIFKGSPEDEIVLKSIRKKFLGGNKGKGKGNGKGQRMQETPGEGKKVKVKGK